MFILLLLTSPVASEWVEIAQNHYRKEPFRRVTDYEETSKGNRIYINHTITERPWNRGVATRIPNVGNVKRVKLPSKINDEFTIGILYDNTEKTTIDGEYENFSSVRAPNLKNEKNSETINVKRKNNNDINTRKRFSGTNDELNIRSSSQYPIRRTQVTLNNTSNIFKQNRKGTIEEDKSEIVNKLNTRKHEIFNVDYDFTLEQNTNVKRFQNVADVNKHENNESNLDSKKYSNKSEHSPDYYNNKKADHIEKPANNKMQVFKTVSPKSSIPSQIFNNENKSRNISNPNKSSIIDIIAGEINRFNFDKSSVDPLEKENSTNVTNNNKLHTDQEPIIDNNNMANNSKNNVEVLLKFMKLITDNIAKNTRRSFKGKMKYMEVLRNNILLNIEERIDQAWPDDGQRRRRRAARGHVEFPSSESALMTISFLTFAVFLIKLVLQVIHTYKNKTMMVTPAVVAAVGRATAALREQASN